MTRPYAGEPARDSLRAAPRPEEETRPIANGPIGFDGPVDARRPRAYAAEPVETARRIDTFRRIGTASADVHAPAGTPRPDAAVHAGATPTGPDPDVVHRDPRFRALRSRVRRFVFLSTTLFLSWYGVYVGLSAFAPSLMRIPVIGSVNVGLLLGLAQFVSTLAIVAVYGRFARREIDPRVRELRLVHNTDHPASQTTLISAVDHRRTS